MDKVKVLQGIERLQAILAEVKTEIEGYPTQSPGKRQVCKLCEVPKPEQDFYLLRSGRRSRTCRVCLRAHRNELYADRRAKRFGVTVVRP
jgi:formylglycine-generating enzyme required for sulfatase activity